ncbi:hypothetical protein WKK05_37890 (plasmid) [Nostoc sp. UHCC 0302]|uniref:hypothetical protein n=1 Tax=Nostoc sp. UHCC 0302 TaxID=3134896 RepID=UPI00311CCCB6
MSQSKDKNKSLSVKSSNPKSKRREIILRSRSQEIIQVIAFLQPLGFLENTDYTFSLSGNIHLVTNASIEQFKLHQRALMWQKSGIVNWAGSAPTKKRQKSLEDFEQEIRFGVELSGDATTT